MSRISLRILILLIGIMSQSSVADSQLVQRIRSDLQTKPRDTVDQLNQQLMTQLLDQREFAAVEEFAIAGTVAVADDPARLEQLQKHRVRALLAQGRPQEALRAAKALFNVCTMHFVVDALPLLTDALTAAHPDDPSLVPRFRLQVLANAQEVPAERDRLRAKYGNNSVIETLAADPEPYVKAIRELETKSDYRSVFSEANLQLLSGHIAKAAELLDRAYKLASPAEITVATEGLARKLKAEDGAVGRANQFVGAIRPTE